MRRISLIIAASLWTASAGADNAAAEQAVAEAAANLKAAQEAGFEWQLIDSKATGKGSSVPISELLDIARKKLEEGDAEEAARIAEEVSHAARMGLEQAQASRHAEPWYGEN